MILSHAHRFIFLHNRKTAGSSISVALARYLGPEDLQLSAIVETLREGIPLTARVKREANRQMNGTLPLFRLLGPKLYGRVVTRAIDHSYRPLLGRKPPHSPAATIERAFPQEWRGYTKFCVVRNPWDKTVSDYFWRIKGKDSPPSFSDYVHALAKGDTLGGIVPLEFHDNWPLYSINNQIAADRIIRYETLAEGLKDTLAAIGIDWDGWLPHAKSGTRKSAARKGDYRSHYDDETSALVAELYAPEIAAHGYAF
ncbi:hypothetical protein BMG00_01230 [Thioclava marina]|uniref:Sulfotransferase family protein n=1 Tax=Thioclava marina TaxID=1915077 RepID=A0ABX3MLU4_9RHOB|nr:MULTISPECIES: sulfotransferase family 2 domain-containing protein [Thioclava]OOY12508.1 hypothetical protein BMG00_01230 [Thioclava marina]OOY28529.1 hypothetical protein BMI90_07625 [Thioclava sp. L04-15]